MLAASTLDAWNALLNVVQTIALTYIAARWGGGGRKNP